RHPKMPTPNGTPITVVIQAIEGSKDTAPTVSVSKAFLRDHHDSPVPASGELLAHAACSGAVQRISFSETGAVTKLEIPQRIFNAHQRRALMVRDGSCVIPGCNVPSDWCEAHHVTEWSRGGPTSIDNAVQLCFYHHRNIDNIGWKIKMVEGLPYVQSPPWLDPQQKWHRVRPPTQPPSLETQTLEELCARIWKPNSVLRIPESLQT